MWQRTRGEGSLCSAFQKLNQGFTYEQLVSLMKHITCRLAHYENAERVLHKWCGEFLRLQPHFITRTLTSPLWPCGVCF
jgi:hypothetical protein